MIEASVTLNYTSILNVVFLALGALLVWRYFHRGGGLQMLRMMNAPIAHEHANMDMPNRLASETECVLRLYAKDAHKYDR